MGKSYQYRNWCITWNDDNQSIDETDKEGQEYTALGNTFTIFIGPREQADSSCKNGHRHILLHCATASISKRKACEALGIYLQCDLTSVLESVLYIKRLETTKPNYLAYIYKQSAFKESASDIIVKSAIKDIQSQGVIPSLTSVKRKLIDDNGAEVFHKKLKAVTDIYMTETDVATNSRGLPTTEMDTTSNVQNFIQSLFIYKMNLERTRMTTTHKLFQDAKDCLKDIAYMISLLPLFTHRVDNKTDNIPALYYWGQASCGKSSFFMHPKQIKKIATDATGVGRFKLTKMQTAYLFDDITTDNFRAPNNNTVIKQLTLGDSTQIKVHSDTQEVRAFVILTSNEKPWFYVKEEGDTPEMGIIKCSWQRRFITAEFQHLCVFDSIDVNHNDELITYTAAAYFANMYDQLAETYKHDDKVLKALKLFDIYYNVAINDYKETLTQEMQDIIINGNNKAIDYINDEIDFIANENEHIANVFKGVLKKFKVIGTNIVDNNTVPLNEKLTLKEKPKSFLDSDYDMSDNDE